VKCTVFKLAGADGATKAVGLLETDSVLLVVDRARPVFYHCLFFLVRDARYRPESIAYFGLVADSYSVHQADNRLPAMSLRSVLHP